MAQEIDPKMRLRMGAMYVSSLERLLKYEQDTNGSNPTEVMGYKGAIGKKVLSRGIFGLYEELCSIGERETADTIIAKYRHVNRPAHSLVQNRAQ